MTSSAAGRPAVLGVLLAVQVLFAVHYVVAKVLLATVPAPAWAALRVLGAAALFLLVYVARGPRPVRARDHRDLALLALLGIVVNQVCFIEGLSRTTPAHSALINTTIPVLTLLFAIVLRRERARPGGLAGIALAMAGVLTLLAVDRLAWGATWLAGDVLTQINAASFSLFLVLSRGTIRRVGATAATAGLLSWGALGVSLYGGHSVVALDPAIFDARILALAGYVIVFATVATYLLNSWALVRVESSQVALFIYLQPVLAAALSVAFLGERITARLVVATVLVFLGVLLAARDREGARPPPPANAA